jgi:hypothetical protein
MRQETEVKQENCHIKPRVTVTLHDRLAKSFRFEAFFDRENVLAASFLNVFLARNTFFFSDGNLTKSDRQACISASRSRLRRISLPQSKLFSAEARLVLSESCIFRDVSAAAIDAGALRAQADNQQNRHSIDLKPGDSRTSRIVTQPGSLRGLGSHDLKNFAAHLPVVCGPKNKLLRHRRKSPELKQGKRA